MRRSWFDAERATMFTPETFRTENLGGGRPLVMCTHGSGTFWDGHVSHNVCMPTLGGRCTVNVDTVVRYWLETAEDDWPVAEHPFASGDYRYALFFGHLYLEKLLKA